MPDNQKTIKEKRLEKLKNDPTTPVDAVENWMNESGENALSLNEVMKAAPADSEVGKWIKSQVEKIEKELWDKIENATDDWERLKLLSEYLEQFFEKGLHDEEAISKKKELEEILWNKAMAEVKDKNKLTDDVLSHFKLFKKDYPDSSHMEECEKWLDDKPWINTIKEHKIESYESYKKSFPGKHDKEADEAIEDIQDDKDWENACKNASLATSRDAAKQAYQSYLDKHPKGKYVEDANNRINNIPEPGPLTDEQILFRELREDINRYNPLQIQEKVKNHYTEWKHLVDAGIFDQEECDMIRNWDRPYALIFPEAPDKLTEGTTEAYFWGTPATGKTCAMGAVLSAAKSIEQNLTVKGGSGMQYADKLSSMLATDKIALLPYSNPNDKPSVSEMYCSFSREEEIKLLFWRKKMEVEHEISIVDVAGEVFTSMYMSMDSNLRKLLKPSDTELLGIIKKFMETKSKDKIHFFVIEYGAGGKKVSSNRLDQLGLSLTQDDILSKGLEYLKDNKILGNSVSVNVLVTKSDLAPVPYGKTRDEVVRDFVKQEYGNFWRQLNKATEAAKITNHNRKDKPSYEPEIIPFSIGKVFAQNLCRFEYDNGTKEVMKVILEKTYGAWSKLLIFLRS